MHRHFLKSLTKVTEDISYFYKSEESHPLKNQKPHLIFSTENPMHSAEYEMPHEDMVHYLKSKDYKVHELKGKYGGKDEKSIMVEDIKPHQAKSIMKYAKYLGQDSAIYSDGKGSHELHYLNGVNANKHHKGFGTSLPLVKPEDNYSEMEDGTVFSHSFDFENLHPSDKSMLRQHFKQEALKKSETNNKKFYIPSSLRKSEHTGKEMNLVHYSPKKGLKEITTDFHGSNVRTTGERGAPEHKLAFYYREGATPEEVVASGAQSKYVAKLGSGHRLYDLGEDTENVRNIVKTRAEAKQVNPGAFTADDIHRELKDRGYHGFFNSKGALPDAVAMFHTMPVHEEHELHPNDFKKVSARDHHKYDKALSDAKQHAEKTGHHDPKFLANLVTSK